MSLVDFARTVKHHAYRSSLPAVRRWYAATEPIVQWWHRRLPYRYAPADFGDLFITSHTEPFDRKVLDKPIPRVIYTFWTGDNEMPDIRRQNLLTLISANPTIDVRLITSRNLAQYLLPEYPLHPAYEYLSYIHRSDYLRCYMMNFYGGGYSDIKAYRKDWASAFERLETSEAWVLGYRNPVRWMTPNFADRALQRLMVRTSDQRIGQAGFICRASSPFTLEWWRQANAVLDQSAEELRRNPGDLNRSENPYALGFTQLLAQIIDPLAVKYHQQILYDESVRFDESVPYL